MFLTFNDNFLNKMAFRYIKMHHMTPLKYQIAIYVYALLPVVYKRRDVMNASALSYSVGFAI